MTKRLIVIFLIFPLHAFSQNNNYINYHKEIIKAEEAYLSNDIKGSIAQYHSVIAKWKKPFAKDCFVALELACMVNDTGEASFFFQKCFETGVDWDALSRIGWIKELLRRNPDYADRIYDMFVIYRRQYIQSLDFYVRMRTLAMVKADDLFRNIPYIWKEKKVIDSLDVGMLDENLQNFVTLTKKYGLPGQHYAGIKDFKLDSHSDSSTYLNLTCIFEIILLHHGCGYFLLSKEG